MNIFSFRPFFVSASIVFCISSIDAMTISGPITASNVTISGDVTMSSMTASSMTVTTSLQFSGGTTNYHGTILQIQSSSTAVTLFVTTTYYYAIPITSSFTVLNASDYVRVSLNGMLGIDNPSLGSSFLTIMRDGNVDLGEIASRRGLSIATSNQTTNTGVGIYNSVGITVIDFPGSTGPHTYQPYIYVSTSATIATFTANALGSLSTEEIHL